MADHPLTVLGDGNIAGSHFTNVGNRTIYNIYPPERKTFTLESRVSFDALLNSEARYPAPKCHPATRKMAQKVAKNWLCRKGEGSEKGIMWMSGAPGVGKSAVAQTVCEELCGDDGSKSWLTRIVRRDRYLDGSFFFGRGVENRERASFFPATIAYQLCRSRASCRTAINRAIEKRPHVFSEDLPSQFRQLLTKPAQKIGFLQGPLTIVIDGLDECSSIPDQVTLLELILEAVKTGSIRFLISSRPEQHIHSFFHRRDVSQHTWHIRLDEETFNTSQDIKVFLREEFARIRQARPETCTNLANGEGWPGERVLDHLTVESDSQFMFPTLAVAFVDTPFFSPDEQLRILLTSPPSRAFSTLDDLYHKILSRRPPTEIHGEADHYQEVVMAILRVIISWPGDPLSAAKIAAVLDRPVHVVQSIIRGPMRSLLKFHTIDLDSPITLCHKSLRDYLLDRNRSQEFFIPSAEADDVFATMLSRRPSSRPSHPYSTSILMDVLTIVMCSRFTVPHIAALLDVDPAVIEHVVSSGPTNLLFKVDKEGVGLCAESFKSFLQDADRSGVVFIPDRRLDVLLARFLSRGTSSDPSILYSRDDVLNILATTPTGFVISWPWTETFTTHQIAALLDLDVNVVESIVKFGAAKWLFRVDERGQVFLSIPRLEDFLRNVNRSGEFFVASRRIDPFFIRILSQYPFSVPPCESRNLFMNILATIVAFEGTTSVGQIASFLDVDPTLVEDIVKFGPIKSLFNIDQDEVKFITKTLIGFLTDVDRSGLFFVSYERTHALFAPLLSRTIQLDTTNSYSRNILLDILAVIPDRTFYPWTGRWTVSQIAAFLEVDINHVEHVVKLGATISLFRVHESGEARVMLSSAQLGHLLRDADRAGEFFLSIRREDRLFIRILSRYPTSDPTNSSSHNILMSVLAVIVAFNENASAGQIASVLDVDSTLIEGVVKFGSTKSLFKAYNDERIVFSTESFGSFLRDADRSGSFFISQGRIDALFTQILSRETNWAPSHSYSRDFLASVLTVIVMMESSLLWLDVAQVAAFLDVDPDLVQAVVLGPTKGLFHHSKDPSNTSPHSFRLSTKLLQPFLEGVNRSGHFCITERRKDALLLSLLSRQPSSDPSLCYSRDDLMNVLTAMASFRWRKLTVSSVASVLEVDTEVIERIVLGPLNPLFYVEASRISFTVGSLDQFFLNADRSGEFFISGGRIDAIFSRLLSRQPLSNPSYYAYSRDALMGVLSIITMISSSSDRSDWPILRLAAFLGVTPTLVEAVVTFGPAKLFFATDIYHPVTFSSPLIEPFLKDAGRSGQFFVNDKSLDPFFIRIFSSAPPLGSQSYSRDVLKDVLTMNFAASRRLTVAALAVALDVNPGLVEGVLEVGSTRLLFNTYHHYEEEPTFSTSFIAPFLRDVERSGEFYISDAMIDALFIRTLSLPPPPYLSHLHSKDVLLGVMAVILASPEPLSVSQIAALLDVDRSLVEGVVQLGRAKVFFYEDVDTRKVTISAPLLKPFLQDAARSGEFFISPTMSLDTIPKPWLQARHSDSM